jgi:phosphomannomutase / phosphoglucomutase
MHLAPTMFREYDLRGRVPEVFPDAADELSDEGMCALGRGFGTLAVRRGLERCVVGHDLRTYSQRLSDRFVEGVVSTGLRVHDVGCVLTPMLYFSQLHLDCAAGTMITASHNPQGWSGLKMSLDYVRTMLRPDLEALEALCEAGDFERGRGERVATDVREAWMADLLGRVRLPRPLRIVLDPGNGTAALFCAEVFRRAGADVVELFCDPDPTFPNHFPNPSELAAREAIRERVVASKADLGFSFDGDGDRLGVQDHRGRDVNADLVLMLLARPVLARHPGAPVVFDVKCTRALADDVRAHGGRPVMWKTGHSWIKAKMRELDAPIAGERSGHFFLRDGFHGYDDGIFAGLRLAELVGAEGRPLASILDEAPHFVTSPEIHVDCPDDVKYQVSERLVAELKARHGDRVNDVNGARVSYDDGWGLVRPSSNLPELVLVFEGTTREAMARIKEEFRRLLATHPEIGDVWHNE